MGRITDKFFEDFFHRALFELQLITVRKIGVCGNNISSTFCMVITKLRRIIICTRARSHPILFRFLLGRSISNICNLQNKAANQFSLEFLP